MRVIGIRTTWLLVVATSLLATARARANVQAAPEVIAVVAGANVGAFDDDILHFAESDARRFRQVLIDLGQVRAGRALLVLGGGPDQIVQALTEARGRAAELASSGRRVTLLFYYSGHGDDEALHLPQGALPLSRLREAIARVPADLRVSILDSCRTGGRIKGVTRGPAFALIAAPDEPRGTVELRASSLGEAAQESEELAGAVFTHFLISGLRGGADGDGDGRVTLAELYSYTYRRTLMRTGSAAVLQHPALQVSLAGAGEVVLSRPSVASASIEVPRGADRYLVFALPSQAAMGELSGETGGRLALPSGKFLVIRRGRNFTGVASIDLSWGGRRALSDGDFRPIAREELAARGGQIELRHRRLDAQTGVELAPRSGENPAMRVGPVLSYASGVVALELEAAYVTGAFASTDFNGQVHSLAGGPALSLRFHLGRITLAGVVGGEVRYSWQRLVRVDAERAAAAGFAPSAQHAFGSVGPRIGLRLTMPLGHHMTAGLSTGFTALVRRESVADEGDRTAFHPLFSTSIGVGYAF